MKWVWVFMGNAGCEVCHAMTGGYDQVPARPHPGCDCEIRGIPVFGTFKPFYKNKEERDGGTFDTGVVAYREYVNNSSATVTHTLEVSGTVEGEVSVSAELDGLFGVSAKYSASQTVTDSAEVELEPGEGARLSLIGILRHVTFSAERWYKVDSPAGGEPREIFDAKLEDEIEAYDAYRVETEDF